MVNERFAKKFFGDTDPIGKRFGAGDPKHTADYEIVGVVEDTKYQDTHGPAYSTYFLPYLQSVQYADPADESGEQASQTIETIELHVTGTPENLESTLRRELAQIDPDMTVQRVSTFDEQVGEALNQERLLARLTTLFGYWPWLWHPSGCTESPPTRSSSAPGKSAFAWLWEQPAPTW